MVKNIFAIVIFIGMFLVGFFPLLKILKIQINRVKTHAHISNVHKTSSYGGRSRVEYTALITFEDNNGETISREHTSMGKYLLRRMNARENEIPLTFSKNSPTDFFLPKDIGDIAYSVTYCTIALLGIASVVTFGFA